MILSFNSNIIYSKEVKHEIRMAWQIWRRFWLALGLARPWLGSRLGPRPGLVSLGLVVAHRF